jgi:hypothetical protein
MGVLNAAGRKIDHFLWVAMEKSAPFDLNIFAMDYGESSEAYNFGKSQLTRALKNVSDALQDPTLEVLETSKNVQFLKVPPWAMAREKETVLNE